jgi:putative phosphoesterase
MVIGVISDTHGLLRPEVFEALARVELILHAGDVGGQDILIELATIAPVRAVYGNCDPPGDPELAAAVDLTIKGRSIHVSHGHECGSPTPDKLLARYNGDVLVYGHTHRPLVEHAGSRLVLNPGAAGPRRFNLKPSVALLTVSLAEVTAQVLWL